MRSQILCALAVVVACSMATAAQANIIAQYHLGETGTLGSSPNYLPIDTTGGHNFLNLDGAAPAPISVTGGAPGSTNGLSFTAAGGYYYVAGDAFIPADNFRVEIWAKPSEIRASNFLSLGTGTGFITIGLMANGNWMAGHNGVDWIGAENGAGQPVTVNVWTKLAVEQVNGISTFYINDVAQAPTSDYVSTVADTVGGLKMHLGISPGGYNSYRGVLDEVTISTVEIPEPSTLALLTAGLLGLLAYAWRKRK